MQLGLLCSQLLETEKLLKIREIKNSTITETVAHTRGKTLFPAKWYKHQDKTIVIEEAKTIKLSKLLESLKKGSKDGEALFISSSYYAKSYLSSDSGTCPQGEGILYIPKLNGLKEESDNESDTASDSGSNAESESDDDEGQSQSGVRSWILDLLSRNTAIREDLTSEPNAGERNFWHCDRHKCSTSATPLWEAS